MKSFAPWYYFIKVAFLVGGIVGMEAYCHYNAYYGFPLNVLVGLFAALIGTKIQDDHCIVVRQRGKVEVDFDDSANFLGLLGLQEYRQSHQ